MNDSTQPARHASATSEPYRDGTFVPSDNGTVRVCFTHLGEGFNGEYDETDPSDAALYRLDVEVTAALTETVYGEKTDDPDWVYPSDGSICTVVHVDGLTADTANALLTYAANKVADAIASDSSVKSAMDALSHLPTQR